MVSEQLQKAMDLVRQARADSWREMAKTLPNHHVLAVEMFRVDRNETVSIFTIVKNGEVVQQVLQGDGRGLNVRPIVPRKEHCIPYDMGREFILAPLFIMDAAGGPGGDDDGPTSYAVAIGDPPPKQPPDPGVVAVGGTGLQNAFDTGEIVTGGS